MRGVPCPVQHDRWHDPDRDAAETGSPVPVVMTGQGDMPMYRLRLAPTPVLAASLAVLLAGPVSAAAPSTELVSVSSTGEQANIYSLYPSISADGRFVAFVSGASDLVAGDTNGAWDIFVRDRQRGTTRRVSVSSAGRQAKGYSGAPSISADGRFVAFASSASNLVAATRTTSPTSSCAARSGRDGP